MRPVPLDRYTDIVLGHRWQVIALSALVILALACGLPYVDPSNEYRDLFDEQNPQLIALDELESTYSSSDTALIAMAPRSGTVFTREALQAMESLTEAAWSTPYSTRVDSLTNYAHVAASEDTISVGPLVEDAGSLTDESLARIQEIALSASEIVGRLVSPDGSVAGVAITLSLPMKSDQATVETTDFIAAVLDEVRAQHPDLEFFVTGHVALNRAMLDAMQADISFLGTMALLIILIVTTLLLRSAMATLSILFVAVAVMMSGMGFAGWTGMLITGTNITAPMIMMVITFAHSIHVVSGTADHMRQGLPREAALAQSLQDNLWPVFLTSVTTAIGFLSLNFSETPPFRVLGNLVGFGVLCAFVFSMTLLPALLSLLPLGFKPSKAGRIRVFDRFADLVIRFRTALLWGFSLMAITLILGIPRLELTENWTELFDETYEFRRATDFVANNLTGLEALEYSLDSGVEGGISDPEYLRKVDAFANWFRSQPEVSHVQAFPDIMKRLNKSMHGDDPEFYRLPDDPNTAAQYLLLYELSLPFGMDITNRIDIGKSATRMTVVLRRLPAKGQLELDQRAQSWLEENAPELKSPASGVSAIFANFIQTNVEGMLRGTIIAMVIVSLLLILVFRNLRLGLICLVPNFIPAAITLGLWGYLVGSVGVAASIVTAIAFGIVVDDTIHFMTKYMKARKNGLSSSESIRSTFRSVGHALWTTTAVFSLSFLTFAASDLANNRALGLLIAMTIFIAVVADFLLLPPLLMALGRRKR